MARVAPRGAVTPVLRFSRPALPAREIVGIGVVLAIVLVAAVSLRQDAEGPDWGLQLAQAPDGGVVALNVRGHGVAWEQHVRPGDRVVSLDSADAHNFVGQHVGAVREIAVADANGVASTVRAPALSEALKLWLTGVALLFALLGAVVYRWSLDPPLARTFLVFGGATALGLASMPGALRGNAPVHFLCATAATVAAAAFTALFFRFPRPIRHARTLTIVLAVLTASLVMPLVVLYIRGEGAPPPLETALFVWLGGNLVVGTLVLAWRAADRSTRHLVAPLAVGIGVGIAPLAFLDALPQVLGYRPIMWADSASVSVAAIPVAFAYAILRHRLFALDAHVRRFVIRVCAALTLVGLFVPAWLVVSAIGIDDQVAVVISVLIVALSAPTVFDVAQRVLESVFYPPLGLARAGILTDGVASAGSIANAFVVRSREFVPTRWAALMVHESMRSREPGWLMIASDGDVPSIWPAMDQPATLASLTQELPELTVLRMDRPPILSVAVCLGARLDGTPLGGVDTETVRLLAARVLPLIEAALLRERTEANAHFREGLWELARELAAAGPESDVYRVTAQHAERLLGADRATVLIRETSDGQAYVPVDTLPELDTLDELDLAIRLDMTSRSEVGGGQVGYVSYVNPPDKRAMMICRLGAAEPADALLVLVRRSAFWDEDARRAVEVAEHVSGALRRSRMSAEAAEARALHEVERSRTELLTTVAHEVRNPLTSVLGYAQMLQRRAKTATRADVARIAKQIEYAAAATRESVRDFAATTLPLSRTPAVRVIEVDLSSAIRTFVHSFQVLPGGERIQVDVPAGVCAQADPSRLDQMIGSLLLDALRSKHTRPLVVRARTTTPGEVWIEICDQGLGTARDADSQEPSISLSVVRSLAELQGGRIELDSTPQAGSIFRIVLRRAPELERSMATYFGSEPGIRVSRL